MAVGSYMNSFQKFVILKPIFLNFNAVLYLFDILSCTTITKLNATACKLKHACENNNCGISHILAINSAIHSSPLGTCNFVKTYLQSFISNCLQKHGINAMSCSHHVSTVNEAPTTSWF